jgi:hypothetical protein
MKIMSTYQRCARRQTLTKASTSSNTPVFNFCNVLSSGTRAQSSEYQLDKRNSDRQSDKSTKSMLTLGLAYTNARPGARPTEECTSQQSPRQSHILDCPPTAETYFPPSHEFTHGAMSRTSRNAPFDSHLEKPDPPCLWLEACGILRQLITPIHYLRPKILEHLQQLEMGLQLVRRHQRRWRSAVTDNEMRLHDILLPR